MKTLLVVLGSVTVIAVGITIWFGYQCWVAHELLRSLSRLIKPEVERDADGRPLKERI